MSVTALIRHSASAIMIPSDQLKPNPFSLSVYGDPAAEIDDLMPSIRDYGILVPLVVVPEPQREHFEVVSGHRRLACARVLGTTHVPCEIRHLPDDDTRSRSVLEYNRQRRKTFSQLMREADAFEKLWAVNANCRSLANLRRGQKKPKEQLNGTDCRNSDSQETFNSSDHCDHDSSDHCDHDIGDPRTEQRGRTDAAIAQQIELGGKDLYRQARKIWRLAQTGDVRAQSGLTQLDARTKTIHAVYKDLRRRDRFSSDFRPTPYDVWSFRHDRAFGIPHPGDIPPGIIAHAVYYFTPPNGLVVDPMAGGGSTIDVCQSMGRRCLAYDLHPTRADIHRHDVRSGFPSQGIGCDLIFCDPPYHTMLAHQYARDTIASAPLTEWVTFLHQLTRHAFDTLRPGGYLALLLACQTEKDLPAGFGYLDHAIYGYTAALRAGFLPERRISCPMDGAYLPQHVRKARTDGRLLGQVRDLLVMRKPLRSDEKQFGTLLGIQEAPFT